MAKLQFYAFIHDKNVKSEGKVNSNYYRYPYAEHAKIKKVIHDHPQLNHISSNL